MRRPGEGAPGDGLRRPGVDEAEGAEVQRGPRSQRDAAAAHPIHWSLSRHTMCPLPGAPTVGVLYHRQ
jgi:hypothetical protein